MQHKVCKKNYCRFCVLILASENYYLFADNSVAALAVLKAFLEFLALGAVGVTYEYLVITYLGILVVHERCGSSPAGVYGVGKICCHRLYLSARGVVSHYLVLCKVCRIYGVFASFAGLECLRGFFGRLIRGSFGGFIGGSLGRLIGGFCVCYFIIGTVIGCGSRIASRNEKRKRHKQRNNTE